MCQFGMETFYGKKPPPDFSALPTGIPVSSEDGFKGIGLIRMHSIML